MKNRLSDLGYTIQEPPPPPKQNYKKAIGAVREPGKPSARFLFNWQTNFGPTVTIFLVYQARFAWLISKRCTSLSHSVSRQLSRTSSC